MYIVSKLIDYATPRVNPNVNCGLWLTIICQCIFMNYNKYTASQVRDVGNKAGCEKPTISEKGVNSCSG